MSLIQTVKSAMPRPMFEAAKSARNALRPFLRHRSRLAIAMGYLDPSIKLAREWSFKDTETSNFNYALTDHSKQNLAHALSVVFNAPVETIYRIFAEIEHDAEFNNHVKGAYVGRRLGWYAAARLLKPKLLVETGVDLGLGSCVLCSALLRNAAEGHPGRYVGTDIMTSAGALFTAPYNSVGQIVYNDSIATLETITEQIDLFINDSDHSADYEGREYEVIKDKMSVNGVILGDNSHVTRQLADFSERAGRKFLFFKEQPKDHWYPGAGIGISFT